MEDQHWESLAAGFAACTLSKEEWTHEAHLAVGAWYLMHYPPEEAGRLMREGIRRLNLSLGGANTDEAGFHETLTEFWLRELRWRIGAGQKLNEILSLPSGYWKQFYSLDLPKSREARKLWVEPDLRPIGA
jgi:hypothetical protein